MSEAVRVVGEVVDEAPADGGWLLGAAAPPLSLPPDGPPLPLDPLSPPYPPALASPLGDAPLPEPLGATVRKRTDRAPRSQLALVEIEPVKDEAVESVKQRLVAFYVDEARGQGVTVTSRALGWMAKEIGKLVDEGVPARDVALGLRKMVRKGLCKPRLLHEFVAEASWADRNGRAPKLTARDVLRIAQGLTDQ